MQHVVTLDDTVISTSDHLPLLMEFETMIIQTKHISPKKCIAWNKCNESNILEYQHKLTIALNQNLANSKGISPDKINDVIVQSINSAQTVLPRSNFNKFVKPYWNALVKQAHAKSRCLRRQWIAEGRPRGGGFSSYRAYKCAKSEFRKTQRLESEKYLSNSIEELNEAAETDYRLFWKLLRKRNNRDNFRCSELHVGDLDFTDDNVVEGFKTHYESIFCNDLDYPNANFYDYVTTAVNTHCLSDAGELGFILHSPVTDEELNRVIKSLKKRKSPGIDDILNEHVIYGGPSLSNALVTLLNTILRCENIPKQWKTGIIIPLYKGRGKSKSDPYSYRPITLLTCFNKLFEKVILDRFNNFLNTSPQAFPNTQQHGFQKGLSCITAAFNLQETIYQQIERKSDVFAAFLDIKGAFDVVWHKGLFYKLGNLGIKGKLLRLLI